MQITQENKISHEDIVFLDKFILDCLTLVKDYARTEDEKARKRIHALISEVYESLPFPVTHVPVLPPEEWVDFILKNI